MALTKEQQSVIDSKEKKLIVSASAGSGKTMVMIKKIVEMICDESEPKSLENFLVVTFTRAAASEMKEKLLTALEDIPVKTDFVKEQINNVATSSICTLDSFCSKLLKIYFYELDLDPAFSIVDGEEKESLQNKAFEKLCEDCFESKDEAFFEVSDIFSGKRKLDDLKNAVLKINEFLNVQPEPEDYFFEKLNYSHNVNLSENPCAEIINEDLLEQVDSFEKRFKQIANPCLNIKNDRVQNAIAEMNANFLRFDKSNNLAKNLRALSLFERIDIIKPRIQDNNNDDNVRKLFDLKNDINKEIQKLQNKYPKSGEQVLEELAFSKNKILSLYALVKQFKKNYDDLKKEKALLDFSDVERFVYELLKNSNVVEDIKTKIKYVFIDEYQDINMLQDTILQKLSANGNVFMVGDVKQNIYAFRHCDPQIFLNKQKLLEEENPQSSIYLNANFRSHKQILSFANSVFTRTMKKEFSGIDYEHTAKLVQTDDFEIKKESDEPTVNFICLQKGKSTTEERPFEVYSVLKDSQTEDVFESGELEGKILANKILQLKQKFISLPKSKTIKAKQIDFSDIVVLVSSRNKELADICKQLELNGIPYVTDVKEDIFDDDIMSVLLNILKLAHNKNLDYELLSVLSSVCFNISFNELATIKMQTSKHNFFYECVQEYATSEKFDGELQDKVKRFYLFIEDICEKSKFLKVNELICEIVKQLNLELFALESKDGEKTLSKLNKLLELLNGKSYNESLSKYIVNFADVKSTYKNMGSADAVKITTIHQSKGLEYPIVFMPLVSKMFNESALNDDFILDKKFGVCMNYFNFSNRTKSRTISMLAAKINTHEETVREQLRLLYVALTRPVNHLYIIESVNNTEFKTKSIKKATSFSDFFDYVLFEKNNLKNEELNNFDLQIINEKDVEKIKINNEKRMVEFSDNFVELNKYKNELNEIFNFKYSNNYSTKIPQKISVSEINKNSIKNNEENIGYLFSEDVSLSADIGNAYHKLLSLINLNKKTECEIKMQIQELLQCGKLTNEEIALVNLNHIVALLNNPLLNAWLCDCDCLYKEQQFFCDVEADKIFFNGCKDKIIVFGICDLIFKLQDKIVIIDYKTSKIKNEEKLVEKYKTQLNIYADAMQINFGINNVEKYIYSFELNKFIKI